MAARWLGLVTALLPLACLHAQSANAALEAAEDEMQRLEVSPLGAWGEEWGADGGSDDSPIGWGEELRQLVLGEDGVDEEVLPTIVVGASEAELPEASVNAVSALRRKQLGKRSGLRVSVLESQIVIVSGMESKEQRLQREAAGLGVENVLASALACTPVNGTAYFMLAHRRPLEGTPHRHGLAFFTPELWESFLNYMRLAREHADMHGGLAGWATKIHWNVMPSEQRVPWVLTRPRARVVAHEPELVAQHIHSI